MKILVADDNVVCRKKLAFFIMKRGYEVISAVNGEQAWELWLREKPSIVFTDLNMPGINGDELCFRIREAEETASFIVLVTGEESGGIAKNAEFDFVLDKNYSKADLSSLLSRIEQH